MGIPSIIHRPSICDGLDSDTVKADLDNKKLAGLAAAHENKKTWQ
jgi:hypothetical protein